MHFWLRAVYVYGNLPSLQPKEPEKAIMKKKTHNNNTLPTCMRREENCSDEHSSSLVRQEGWGHFSSPFSSPLLCPSFSCLLEWWDIPAYAYLLDWSSAWVVGSGLVGRHCALAPIPILCVQCQCSGNLTSLVTCMCVQP